MFAVDSVLLYVPAALACTDLILNGVLERHPDLRLGIVELSAVWVPLFLMMLDGGSQFVQQARTGATRGSRCGRASTSSARCACRRSPTSCPRNIQRQLGGADLLMCCSDYPHSEGTARPLADYAAPGKLAVSPDDAPGLFRDNAAFLLRKS